MPKQLKGVREGRDNSQIFKQAKRRFHYQPKQMIYPYFLHSKGGKLNRNQGFKQDYSSVKDVKNENNEINESSWIAKLVNGIQEQFSEEAQFKREPVQGNIIESNNYFSEPMQVSASNMAVAIKKDIRHAMVTRNGSVLNSSNPTKKNSFNVYRKNEGRVREAEKVLKREGSCETISIKNTSHTKCKKQGKVATSCNAKKSPRLKSKSEFSLKAVGRTKAKSVQDVKFMKRSDNKNQCSFNGGDKFATDTGKEENGKSSKSSGQRGLMKKGGFLKEQPIQQINCVASKKTQDVDYESIKQKIDLILDERQTDCLFIDDAKAQFNARQQRSNVNLLNYGAIKKNHVNKIEENGLISKRSPSVDRQGFKKQSTAVFGFQSSWANAISERPGEQNDMITPREEKALIDKYLGSDYSFKSHKLNEGQQMMRSPYRREGKRYSYRIEGGQDSLVQIPTIRQKNCLTQNKGVIERRTSSFCRDNNYGQNENTRSRKGFRYQGNSLRSQIQMEKAMVSNKQNITNVQTRKNSINAKNMADGLCVRLSPRTIRQRQHKIVHLNREVYLHESDKASAVQSLLSSNQFKQTVLSAIKQQNGVVPSKYSYLRGNSTLQQSAKVGRQQGSQQRHSPAVSQICIDRLTSKLNSYISQHHLYKQLNSTSNSGRSQLKHGMLKLNFEELKKHNDFGAIERRDVFFS